MKNKIFSSTKLWKDGAMLAFALLATIETAMGVTAISLEGIGVWWIRLLVIIASYIFITIIVVLSKHYLSREKISLDIRGIKVVVRVGDIFQAKGWRVIPFNEYFDTQVDDIIIDKNSLNGKLIAEYLNDAGREALEIAIAKDDKSALSKQSDAVKNKVKYQLGRIKVFKFNGDEYLLLALTRFNDQEEAHTNRAEFEHTLRTMWKEIDRTYANKPIFIPLIGSGKTRFDDMTSKPHAELLKCLLCTLRTSNIVINKQITILLTQETLQTINLYQLKEG